MKRFTPLETIGRQRKDLMSLTGFSLVELMVTVFISALIFAALFVVLSAGRSSWYTGDTQVRLNEEMRKPLLTMNRELRQTRASEISGVPADNNFYTTITFKLPEDVDSDGDVIDALGNMEWSGNINYSLNAANQIMRSTLSSSSILANSISNLQFRRPSGNPNIIQVYITAQQNTISGRNLQSNIMSSIKLRN